MVNVSSWWPLAIQGFVATFYVGMWSASTLMTRYCVNIGEFKFDVFMAVFWSEMIKLVLSSVYWLVSEPHELQSIDFSSYVVYFDEEIGLILAIDAVIRFDC